ncbi:MAG: TSUP family transporter, partial [Clostridia bacterium]|nr:TSUP family transporter [Clostridia bacterium]
MFWLWYVLAGLGGGLVGGMGMGGGTLLIPIMTLFLGLDQHLSQAINLLVFIPTGILAVIIHAKNKLIDFKIFFWLIIPAVGSAVGFAFLA